MSKLRYSLILIFIICSCNNQNDIQTKNEASPKTTSLKDSVKQDTGYKIYEGLYIYNINTNSFLDCKSPDSTYWVIDESKKLADMYKNTYTNPNVYSSVVVKVKGDLKQTLDETKKESYSQTLYVKEVISMERKNFRNTCVPYDFWALGNEPSWSLEISEKENLIELIVPGEEKVYYFFYAEPKEENGKITYTSHNQIQRYVINVSIKKEKCSDTMSDRVYDYSVEVELTGGKKYKGCGIKGSNLGELGE